MIRINKNSKEPKYRQIVNSVISSIENKTLSRGEQLPSINELAEKQNLAKATVAIAYNLLRENGIIHSQPGKGFYVATSQAAEQLNIFVLFDTMNGYKEVLYQTLKETLPADTRFSIFFHHYNLSLFESLIKNSLGNYNYYIIMPHFESNVAKIVRQVPQKQLLLLDQDVRGLGAGHSSVCQDFENDIDSALESALKRLKKYRVLHLSLGKDHFQYVPSALVRGFRNFCKRHRITHQVEDRLTAKEMMAHHAYILFSDNDLITFLKFSAGKNWKPGKDIGLISYDDTPVKEILGGGITVISTDFRQMGETAAQLICEKATARKINPSGLILRQTL